MATLPQIIGLVFTVASLVWGAAVLATQLRTTSTILAKLEPRVQELEDWKIKQETRQQMRAEVRAELEAEYERRR